LSKSIYDSFVELKLWKKYQRKFPESLVPAKKKVMTKLCKKASWTENSGAEGGCMY
jgi:hypothetical protein